MSDYSNYEDCFAYINFDGDKLFIDIAGPLIGVKFGEASNYVYLSLHENKLLVRALKAAAANVEESIRRSQEDDQ